MKRATPSALVLTVAALPARQSPLMRCHHLPSVTNCQAPEEE
jgi:hypothetical protein